MFAWQINIYTIERRNFKNRKFSDIFEIQNRKQSDTGGLALLLKVKIDTRVMITTNIDVSDRLVNEQLGTVKYIAVI